MSAEKQGTLKYGEYYWYVMTPDAEIRLMADVVAVQPDGSLVLSGRVQGKGDLHPNMILAPGQWLVVYAASAILSLLNIGSPARTPSGQSALRSHRFPASPTTHANSKASAALRRYVGLNLA